MLSESGFFYTSIGRDELRVKNSIIHSIIFTVTSCFTFAICVDFNHPKIYVYAVGISKKYYNIIRIMYYVLLPRY